MMNGLRNGSLLFFLCFVFNSHSQTTIPQFEDAKEAFIQLHKKGSYSKADSLCSVFRSFSEEKSNLPKIRVEALLFQSRLLTIKNKFTESLTLVKEAQTIVKEEHISDPKMEHIIAYYSVYLPLKISKKPAPKLVRDYFQKFQNRTGNDPLIDALSDEYMGRVEQDMENYKVSRVHLMTAIKKLEQLEYQAPLSVSYAVLGATYDLMEDFEMAAKSYEKSVAIGSGLDEPNYNVLASTSFNLSLMFGDRLGNAEKGIEYAEEAIKYDRAGGGDTNPYLALDYNRLASSYSVISNYTKATLYAEKAVAHAKQYFQKQPNRVAETLRALSSVYSYVGRGGEAIALGEEAMILVNKLVPEEHRWVCANYLHMANIYLRLGNVKKAEEFFLKTEKVAIAIDRDLFLIDVYQSLANLYLETGELEKMKLVLDKAKLKLDDRFKEADYFHRLYDLNRMKYAYAMGDKAQVRSILTDLKKLLTNRFTYPDIEIQMIAYDVISREPFDKDAVHYFISEIIDNRNMFPNNSNKVVYSNSVKGLIGLVLNRTFDSYNETKKDDWLPVIFNLIELNKNSILLEGIRNAKLKKVAGVPEELMGVEQALTDSLQKNSKAIYNAKQTAATKAQTIQFLFDKQLRFEEAYDSLQDKINANYPKLARLKNLSSNQGFQSFLNGSLEKDRMVLEYFVDANYWYRFILGKNQISLERFDNSEVLQEEVKALLRGIADRKFDAQKSKKVHDFLVPKISDEITKLTIITDGVLSLVPFEVLQDDTGFLVHKYAISYAGSVQLLEEQMKLTGSGNKWLGFAPSYISNELPNNSVEVDDIQQITNGTSFVGKTATKENFITESERYDLLHLATHTEIDQNNPLYNKMLFATDSVDSELTAAEIYGLSLKANLAVLSSCNTGFGKVEAGEGVMSMSRAFTFAGVSSTLMTLWKVPDSESAEITAYFYQNLEDGQSKDVALQNAKKSYLTNNDDPVLREPFYWAGFVLSGDTAPVLNSSFSWYWLLGVFGLLAVAFYFYKRKGTAMSNSSSSN